MTSANPVNQLKRQGEARVTVEASAQGHKCPFEPSDDDAGMMRIRAVWHGLSPDLKRSILAIIAVAESP